MTNVQELRGRQVRLRPLLVEEERFVRDLRELHGFSGSDSPGARERFRERIERSGALFEGRLWLAVEVDGRLIGDIEARQPTDALPAGVFELGIALVEEQQRRGYGTDAVETLTAHLFAAVGAERVQASTAAWNAPMQKVLERLRFRREGVLRAFMPVPGGRDDYVLYAVTRGDWESR